MDRPIKLDYQPFRRAVKIDHIPPDALLAPKLAAIELTELQVLP
jgi:hypothetical protein